MIPKARASMAEPRSPLEPSWRPGRHGNRAGGIGVTLRETRPGSIVEVAAWPDNHAQVALAIGTVIGLELRTSPQSGVAADLQAAFGVGPGRFLVIDQREGLLERLAAQIGIEDGTVCDLSHGRTALRIAGSRAEWVLAKLFAVDFSEPAFSLGEGRSTAHHDIATAVQRTGAQQFDLYVPRSFARSFWHAITRAAEEVGYEVI
jgi:methylglutamate dehydrogenase subunit D